MAKLNLSAGRPAMASLTASPPAALASTTAAEAAACLFESLRLDPDYFRLEARDAIVVASLAHDLAFLNIIARAVQFAAQNADWSAYFKALRDEDSRAMEFLEEHERTRRAEFVLRMKAAKAKRRAAAQEAHHE